MPDLDTEQKPSRRLWILAALGALALHIGGVALAIAHLRTDDVDDSLGAPAIEIGLEMMSPHLEPTDLPPGPDADASVASPALAEQKAEVKETELPRQPRRRAPRPSSKGRVRWPPRRAREKARSGCARPGKRS